MNYYYKNENIDYKQYTPIKVDYPAFIDNSKYNQISSDINIFSSRIGVLMYGSLCKYPGILDDHLESSEFHDGPYLKINLTGYNRFNNNLTRVVDYENEDSKLIKTSIRIFKKNIGVEQAKRYIVLREGNINYLVHYGRKNDIMINFPEHLNKYELEIKSKMRDFANKLDLDYIFFQAYPPKIKNVIKYLKDNSDSIKNTQKYIKKCDQLTLLDIENKILEMMD
jgi:hypothetical protein